MWSSFLITAVGHVIRCTVLLGAWVPGLHCFTSVTPPAGYTCCLCRNVSLSASIRGEIREKRDPVSPHDREEPYPRLAYFWMPLPNPWASQAAVVVRSPPASVEPEETQVQSLAGRSSRGGHGNPLQCSCLESPMKTGAWRAAVHGATQSQDRATWHTCAHCQTPTVWGGSLSLSVLNPPCPISCTFTLRWSQ